MSTIKKGTLMSQDETIALYPKTSADNVSTSNGSTVEKELSDKSSKSHNHDSSYYSKNDIDTKLSDVQTKLVDGFTVPSTATWAQLTADNIASLDPDYQTVDPALSYPWFTDVTYTCAADDIIEPMWPANVEGIGPYIKVTANKLRIYADSNKNGTALTAFQCKKG